MSIAPRALACVPADVEAWLDDLGLEPIERADREGVASWDVILEGRRRAALRITLILDPALALICWAHFAPPISDSFRRSYRILLRWNDELPFVKFSVGEDERPLLITEIPVAAANRDALGLALARQLAVADRFRAETLGWLKAGGWPTDPAPERDGPGRRLLTRYAAELGELLEPDAVGATGGMASEPTVVPDAAGTKPTVAPDAAGTQPAGAQPAARPAGTNGRRP